MEIDVKSDYDHEVMLALGNALERIDGSDMITTEHAVKGWLVLNDGREAQAFVKIAIFDEGLLEIDPDTGGLLENLPQPKPIEYEQYEHHGREVWVRKDLKGEHRAHCLCHAPCVHFIPEDRDRNCPIGRALYELDRLTGCVTPVYECPGFEEVREKEES